MNGRPPVLLDWRAIAHWSWDPGPCRYCGRDTHLRDSKRPRRTKSAPRPHSNNKPPTRRTPTAPTPSERHHVTESRIPVENVRFVKELYPRLKPHDDVVERYRDALENLPPQARAALRKTKSLIRWLPDILVPGSGPRPDVTVDAKACSTKYSNHSIEMRALACARDVVELPVFYICPDGHAITAAVVLDEGPDRVCCDHCWGFFQNDLSSLPEYCPTYVARGGLSGSKTPFVLVSKARHRDAGQFFPRIGRVLEDA